MKRAHNDVVIASHPVMRVPRKIVERIWKEHGRREGVTITAGENGEHSAGSWHYCGCAEDYRNNYLDNRTYFDEKGGVMAPYDSTCRVWDEEEKQQIHRELVEALPGYDVVLHSTHIHIEPGDRLARQWGILL